MNKFNTPAIFNLVLIIILVLSAYRTVLSEPAPPIPARIGGTITIDGRICTAVSARNEVIAIKVTGTDATSYAPEAEDSDGLNSSGWYIIDIPINEESITAGKAAKYGEKAVIHLYKKGVEATLLKPAKGIFEIGKSGSTTRIDIVAISNK